MKKSLQLQASYTPTGDQPEAIIRLIAGLARGDKSQILLGVTGSGKTFTLANVIAAVQRPTLILAPNKTLAAQLYAEMRSFFPDNAIEYFVSYYDYYQPEAYVPTTDTYIEKDASINSHIELDFMINTKGNKRVANGYEPELRQAFVQYDQWLAGQAWSNFMDVTALPDTLDFVGPTEGTVFNRQAQLRYQHGNWRVSMESPETTLTDLTKANIASGAGRLPDLTARYHHNLGASGYWSAALLLRELRHQVGSSTETETGAGLSLSGRYNVSPQTNLRGALNYGDGIGRYIGLNLVNDAVLDAQGNLQPIEVTAGFLALQHYWQPRLRSSVGVSFFQADPSSNTPALDLTTDSRSAHLNLIYQLQPKLEVGAEISRAERTRDDGAEGSMNRLQLSAKYNF